MSTSKPNVRHRILSPVKQIAADSFLLLMISAFGATVILVRLFLELTGYPQIGDSTFHVAHVLWGGLLLFIAVVLVLTFANRWALALSALFGGIGTGLFIDEVGKFITQKDDYFFPLAFPIIYAFMITCVWLYFRVRHSDPRDPRTLFYHAFDDLKQVLDYDFDSLEHSELMGELNLLAGTAEDAGERKLATALLEFVNSRAQKEFATLDWLDRMVGRIMDFLASTPSRRSLKAIVIAGFVLFAISAFAKLFGFYAIAAGFVIDLKPALSNFLVVNGKSEYIVSHPNLFLANSFLIFAVGLSAIVSALMLLMGHERLGLRIGTLGLVLALTIVNLITFYFSQLYAIADALGQLALIGLAQWFRWRFFLKPTRDGEFTPP